MSENEGGNLYDNGYPFTAGSHPRSGKDRLAHTLDELDARVQNGKASMILIDGSLGEGKTTLAVHVADYYNARAISLNEFLFLGADNFVRGIKTSYEQGNRVIVYDESGDFDKRGALTKLNRMLGRIFDIYRAFKIVVILVLPSFFALDSTLFDKNVPRILLHCHGRKGYGNFSVYSLYRMHWLRRRAQDKKRCVTPTEAFKMVQPNYRGHFKNLSRERSRELDTFSTAGKLDVIDLVTIKRAGMVSYDDVAEKLKLTNDTVRRKISAAGIKPARRFKGKNYYDEKDLAVLQK